MSYPDTCSADRSTGRGIVARGPDNDGLVEWSGGRYKVPEQFRKPQKRIPDVMAGDTPHSDAQ